jgi:hypothetical protein
MLPVSFADFGEKETNATLEKSLLSEIKDYSDVQRRAVMPFFGYIK